MEFEPPSPIPASSSETAVEDFHRQGYVLLPSVLEDAEQIQLLRTAIDDAHARQETKKKGRRHIIYKRVFEDHPALCLDVFKQETVLRVVRRLLGCCGSGRPGQGTGLQAHVIHNNAYRVDPGCKGQAPNWHQDDPPIFITQNGKPLPPNVVVAPLVLTCMYFLNDLQSSADGGTRVIEGSHRFGTPCCDDSLATQQHPAKYVQCPAGSVLILSAHTWHCGAPVTGEASSSRYVFQVSYGRRLVGHKHDSIMNYNLPQRVMRVLKTEEDKKLMGFLQGGAYS